MALGFRGGRRARLLIVWIRLKLKEPERWVRDREAARTDLSRKAGRVTDLFKPRLRRNTMVGVCLAGIGMATFGGAHIYGKDLLRGEAEGRFLALAESGPNVSSALEVMDQNAKAIKRAEMLGMFLVTTGGGLGLLAFGPISERVGRRRAFVMFHLGGWISALIVFQLFAEAGALVLYCVLPVFGFLTLGMHAGYAIYFPELFPTRLRGVGAGFCFNIGRVIAAPVLFLSGWMMKEKGISLENAASALSCLFLLGIVVLAFARETRGDDLPE